MSTTKGPESLPDFAARLAWSIDAAKKSPTRVQSEAGLPQGYIFKLLGRGEAKQVTSPGPDVIRALADCLGVAYEWLAIGRGPVRATSFGRSPLESAVAFALENGGRQDAIDAAIARHRDVDGMTGNDWVLAFNAEANRLERAGVPRPEVLRATQKRVAQLGRTRGRQLAEIAELEQRAAKTPRRRRSPSTGST